MKISVFGAGYVGLVTAACLSKMGHHVKCFDVNSHRINNLNNAKIDIYEPNLEKLISISSRKNLISFTDDENQILNFSSINFICVGTPENEDGSANLDYVNSVLNILSNSITKKLAIIKSTVPPSTAFNLQASMIKKGINHIEIVSNPEFLREGSAINDFMKPDRVVVGYQSEFALSKLKKIYGALSKKIISMDLTSAEMTKYSSNAMLANRISFINEISNISELLGADIEKVKLGIGSDKRIGNQFLNPGPGYGGSCFPKDVAALIHVSKSKNLEPTMLLAADKVNEIQKNKVFNLLSNELSTLTSKNICIWGVTFKANTDDIRESATINLVDSLKKSNANIYIYDPKGARNFQEIYPESPKLKYVKNKFDLPKKIDSLLIMTDWDEFKVKNIKQLKSIIGKGLIIDSRNLFDSSKLIEQGLNYLSFGRR